MNKYILIKYQLCALIVCLFIITDSYAKNNDVCEFEIAPYLWAINMNGHERIGPLDAHINENFSDLLKTLNWGGMLQLGARKDKYGVFIDATYAKTSDKETISAGTLKLTTKYGIFSAGAFYSVYVKKYAKNNLLAIEPYLGARYTLNDAKIENLNNGVSASKNKNWTDPIIGSRVRYIKNNWQLFLVGDVGGTNFNNNKSLNLVGLLGYTPASAQYFTVYLGYRYLYQKYISGEADKLFAWNMRLFGPLLAVAFKF